METRTHCKTKKDHLCLWHEKPQLCLLTLRKFGHSQPSVSEIIWQANLAFPCREVLLTCLLRTKSNLFGILQRTLKNGSAQSHWERLGSWLRAISERTSKHCQRHTSWITRQRWPRWASGGKGTNVLFCFLLWKHAFYQFRAECFQFQSTKLEGISFCNFFTFVFFTRRRLSVPLQHLP